MPPLSRELLTASIFILLSFAFFKIIMAHLLLCFRIIFNTSSDNTQITAASHAGYWSSPRGALATYDGGENREAAP